MTAERWLPVPEWEGFYEVSDGGRVRSLDRILSGGKIRRPMRIKGQIRIAPLTGGYHRIRLFRPGVEKNAFVHRLVLSAFVGPCPPGMQGCHNDGNRTNNNLTNLRWDTPSENTKDSVRHGTNWLAQFAQKTHCPQGHPYDEANTYWRPPKGKRPTSRDCLVCRNRRNRERSRVRSANR